MPRKNSIYKAVREVSKVVAEVLREVEAQEPRFISSLNEINGRFEGLTVISQTEFEVSFLYQLNFENLSNYIIFHIYACNRSFSRTFQRNFNKKGQNSKKLNCHLSQQT